MTKYTLSSLEDKLILFATILASGMAFLDSTVVNIAIPVMQAKFSAKITDMQWHDSPDFWQLPSWEQLFSLCFL